MRWALILIAVAGAREASALPMYALASARTCGNCHVSPTYEDRFGWDNPPLADRKCNLSCMSCHVNPTGGGLRNTAGRYFGQSTLAMFAFQERSYSDVGRDLFPQPFIARRPVPSSQPAKTSTAASFTPQHIPSGFEDVEAGVGANQTGGWSTFGRPLFSPSRLSLWDGRYNDLRADPLLAIGADARAAYWTGSGTFFPMQVDLHAALHPIEHFTVMTTVALRGRANGREAVLGQDRTPIFARNAYAMIHELPYTSYLKAGIFMPSFGTHVDDHTTFTRRYFDMDVSTSDDTVVGVEVGMAPNYPFASVSAFRGISGGSGGALNLGWRDLGWSVSAHAMLKRRELREGGDLDAVGVAFGFTAGYFIEDLPLSLLGEFTIGRRGDQITGDQTKIYALFAELWYTVFNGINVRAKYDRASRNVDIVSETEQRWSLGVDVAVFPGVTIFPMVRVLDRANTNELKADFFGQIHLWF